MKGKKVIVSVINDLSTDQRVRKSCEVLMEMGAEVTLVGRRLPHSLPLERPYRTVRFRLPVHKGFLFYALFNLRLFWFLLWQKADILFCNDLDTLLPGFIVSRLHSKELIYDTHEYFTGIPEIQDRPFVKKVWTGLESRLFPKLEHIITVNDSIARLYEKQFGKKVGVVRNIPASFSVNETLTRTDLDLPEDKRILILQGSGINVDRGAEEAIQAMQFLPQAILLIIGGGDVYAALQELVRSLNLVDKVIFLERMPYERMMAYTALADIGLSLDKDTNINYRYSLPNKLFDYLHAGIPVLSSSVVEVAYIVRSYDVGLVTESHDPEHLARSADELLERRVSDPALSENILRASRELCWENEKNALIKILNKLD